jgi:hypothetical protein
MGGAMGAANWARNLGLTSLDMISKGAGLMGQAGNAAQQWAGIAQGTTLPATSFLVTPQEQFAATTQNRLQSQRVEQQKLNIQAARDPIAGGLSDLVAYLTGQYLGSLGGGKMGGGGGGKASGIGASDYSNALNVPSYGEGTPYSQDLGPALEGAWGGGEFGGAGAGSTWGGQGAPSYINDQYALPAATGGPVSGTSWMYGAGYGYPGGATYPAAPPPGNPAAQNIWAYY